MRTTSASLLAALLLVIPIAVTRAEPAPVRSVDETPTGLLIHSDAGLLRLQVWSDRTIRVTYAPGDKLPETRSFAVIAAAPQKSSFKHERVNEDEVLSTPLVQVKVHRPSGALTFADPAGKALLAETRDAARSIESRRARQTFQLRGNEAIYGLGQHQVGLLNYRGTTVHLQQANTDVAVPMLLSSGGYGVLWDNPAITDVDVAPPAVDNRLAFRSEVADAIDYYFIAGPEADDVIAGYRSLTGAAPLMARWTWGFWQSKERYQSQQELLDVAKKYRELKIPIDGLVQDWQYWGKEQWGSHEFDSSRYPDPRAMMEQLHRDHFHAIISVWPKFDLPTRNLKELEAAKAVYPTTYPSVYPPGHNKWYDAFNPAARDLYWRQISRSLGTIGFDGWWLDASEPELGGHWGELRDMPTGAGPGAAVFNAYPLLHTTAVYAGARRDFPDKRPFILTRSAYAGQQRNAAVTWSGDVRGDWETFRRQIPAGLNFSASGIPYWNTDVGGFFGGKPADPAYRELFVRWFQFGAFCPMFRVHGTGPAKEFWRWDEPAQKILLAYDQLRYRLLPYTYSISWKVTRDGYTMMRPLVMDFRKDGHALNVTDQFMFGPALMASPVTQPLAASRNVYLPGADGAKYWYDFWTGARHDANRVVDAPAPLETMPLFVRAGSILPLGPVVQYADEKPDAPIELRVYPGADGSFELYEDAGDGHGYETGEHATIPITWTDATSTLTLGDRKGEFPGMNRNRRFNVVRVGANRATGVAEPPTGAATPVDYAGTSVTLKLSAEK
jgi:alpha-D-xyloside xylohydrolase